MKHEIAVFAALIGFSGIGSLIHPVQAKSQQTMKKNDEVTVRDERKETKKSSIPEAVEKRIVKRDLRDVETLASCGCSCHGDK